MSKVKEEAKQLSDWTLDGETLSKTFSFQEFLEGIQFVQNVAIYAEGAQHHPHVTIDHTNITVQWTTVDQGALTEKDIDAAKACENLLNG
ncbi:4a-hydroxytetrahydrobiopterin dehydratase [Shouchella shacheensis]|uniref:4a-hydroxytetrahydrobiopterin dehydratase n=1 Tax=Shouchella shacheensis TaxID=1649580 RepID=UPI00073FBDB4|nr:4a-hydroxytetrahydrobiopterin dehydratase [Shouchella shacheensis]